MAGGGSGLEAARSLLRESVDRQLEVLVGGGSGDGAQDGSGWEHKMVGVLRAEMVELLEAAKARL